MIIKVLVENTSVSEEYGAEHGLSLYIETKKNKILFDVGATELFLKNAAKIGVNIADVDFLIVSHGHYDHGGGLKTFFQENKKAKVFLHPLAFGKYYAARPTDKLEFIGIDEGLKENKQIVFTSDSFSICDGVQLFSNVIAKEDPPKSNRGLLAQKNELIVNDSFDHEQNLIIQENGKTLLVTGCAHNGIVNIIKHFQEINGYMPDYVIGGFHLYSASSGSEPPETVDSLAKYLLTTKIKFYTCHCTGIEAYERLKSIMGDSIGYLSAGDQITI